MSRELVVSIVVGVFICAVLSIFPPAAQAGPPLICWPFDIGNAKTLPWGGSAWGAARADYDLGHLVEDTLALLDPSTPVIVRMETLRRATVYAMKDQRIAGELLARLRARARDAELKGKPDALAFFDAGYLAEAYKQARWAPQASWGMALGNPATGLDGYALIGRAIALRGNDPEMEFAAALVVVERRRESDRAAHLRKAVAGAKEGSPLARNLVLQSHLLRVGASTLAELRAQTENTKN